MPLKRPASLEELIVQEIPGRPTFVAAFRACPLKTLHVSYTGLTDLVATEGHGRWRSCIVTTRSRTCPLSVACPRAGSSLWQWKGTDLSPSAACP